MQIGDSSMVEHVSRSHKVPSSNLGRLLLFVLFDFNQRCKIFLRCSWFSGSPRNQLNPTPPYIPIRECSRVNPSAE